MPRIEAALLFTTQPALDLAGFLDRLNQAAGRLGARFRLAESDRPGQIALDGGDAALTVTARNCPLPAASFAGALDGVLSAPFRGQLADILACHGRYVLVALAPRDAVPDRAARVKHLCLTHLATALIAQSQGPAAIHWRPSRQLLLAGQYLKMAGETEPWALFARALSDMADMGRVATGDQPYTLTIADDCGLMGGPIIVRHGAAERDRALAAGLTFLRHAARTGQIIPDGHAFGESPDAAVFVTHLQDPDAPEDIGYLLSLPGTAPEPAHLRVAAGPLSPLQTILGRRAAALPDRI